MVVQQQFNNSARYAHYYEQEFEAKPEDHDGEAVVGGGREPDPGPGPANGEDEKAKLIAAVMEREAAEVITASGHSAPRISRVRQVTYSPWGYHAGCHGALVIMGPSYNKRPASSASTSSAASEKKRFGFDRKRRNVMTLPSPAFDIGHNNKNSKNVPTSAAGPRPYSTNSMGFTVERQPWISGGTVTYSNHRQQGSAHHQRGGYGYGANGGGLVVKPLSLAEQQKIHFRRSSLPLNRKSSSSAASVSGEPPGKPATSQTTTSRNRPPLRPSSSFSGIPSNWEKHNYPDQQLSGLMVTSMKLYERPSPNGKKKSASASNSVSQTPQRTVASGVKGSDLQPPPAVKAERPVINDAWRNDEEADEELWITQATELDDKFCLQSTPPPKVEVFLKRVPPMTPPPEKPPKTKSKSSKSKSKQKSSTNSQPVES